MIQHHINYISNLEDWWSYLFSPLSPSSRHAASVFSCHSSSRDSAHCSSFSPLDTRCTRGFGTSPLLCHLTSLRIDPHTIPFFSLSAPPDSPSDIWQSLIFGSVELRWLLIRGHANPSSSGPSLCLQSFLTLWIFEWVSWHHEKVITIRMDGSGVRYQGLIVWEPFHEIVSIKLDIKLNENWGVRHVFWSIKNGDVPFRLRYPGWYYYSPAYQTC